MDILSSNRMKDFQVSLESIYKEKNKERTPEYIFSYLARNTSYLSRSVLRDGKTEQFFIKTLSWLFAFSSRMEINIEDAFLKKFPEVCPYCLGKVCECVQNHKQPSKKLAAYKIKDELKRSYEYITFYHQNSPVYKEKPFNIDNSVKIIETIYPSNKIIWHVHGSFYHFTRIYEELGEIHEAYTTYKKDPSRKINLEEELADFTAWLLSAWAIEMSGQSLKEALINYYSEGCPVCYQPSCVCSDYSDRKEAILDLKALEELRAEIEKITALTDEKNDELKELLLSIDGALKSKSTTDAKRALTETKNTISDISEISNSASNIGENSLKLAGSMSAIYKIVEGMFSSIG